MDNSNEDISKPIVISYENDLYNNKNSLLFKKTLENNNWDFIFIGQGIPWTSYINKLQGYYNALDLYPENKIVILSDARDVFCLRNTDFFLEKIDKIVNSKIIISSEMFLNGHMNWSDKQISDAKNKCPTFFYQGIPLNNYWNFYEKQNNIPNRKYLNSGLIVGKNHMIKTAIKWILDNNYNDDQLGFAEYTNQFPELIYLDYEANILHTSGGFLDGCLYNAKIQTTDAPTFPELFGLYSYFLHIPGSNISKGQKNIYNAIYNLFDLEIINKDAYSLYNIKGNINNDNLYFITNDNC